MGREYVIQRALAPVYPYVAQMVGLCRDESVIGSEFYVMERLDGTILRKELPFELSARARPRRSASTPGRRWSGCTTSTCPAYPSWRRSAAATGTSRARSPAGPTGSRGRRPTTSATGAG